MTNSGIQVTAVKQLKGHRAAVYALVQSAERGTFYSAGGDGWVVEWNPLGSDTGNILAKIDQRIFAMASDDRHGELFLGTFESEFLRIDLHNKRPRRIRHHEKAIFKILQNDKQVFTLGGDGYLAIWPKEEKYAKVSYKLAHKALRCGFFLDDQKLVVGASDNAICIFDTLTGAIEKVVQDAHAGSVFSICPLPNGLIASGGMDAHLNLWDAQLGLVKKIPAHLFTINAICTLDGTGLFATASRDKTIRLWDMESLELRKVLSREKYPIAHLNSVNTLLWMEDQRLLVSAGDDRAISIWRIASS